jgi:hypothetical protein
VVGFPAGIPKLPLNLTLLKSCDVCGLLQGAFAMRDPMANAAHVEELFQPWDEGKIAPKVMPLIHSIGLERRSALSLSGKSSEAVVTLDWIGPRSYLHARDRKDSMNQFDDRERAFEAKFAHDEDMKFRVIARRNRLLGEWAARQMGLSDAEMDSYAKDVIRADFEEAGDVDVIRKVLGDLTSAGVECDEDTIRETLGHKDVAARRQLMQSTNL